MSSYCPVMLSSNAIICLCTHSHSVKSPCNLPATSFASWRPFTHSSSLIARIIVHGQDPRTHPLIHRDLNPFNHQSHSEHLFTYESFPLCKAPRSLHSLSQFPKISAISIPFAGINTVALQFPSRISPSTVHLKQSVSVHSCKQ